MGHAADNGPIVSGYGLCQPIRAAGYWRAANSNMFIVAWRRVLVQGKRCGDDMEQVKHYYQALLQMVVFICSR